MSKIDAERLNQEGIKQLQNGKLEEASTLFLKAIESDAAYALPYCHIGNILAAVGNADEAIEWFHKAIQLDSDLATAYYGLGSVLYALEKWPEAILIFEQAEQKGLVDGDLYFMLGMAYVQEASGQLARALAYFQLALDKNPDDLEALFQRGLCSAQLGHVHQAKQDFLTVLDKDVTHADAAYNLGVAYAYEGNLSEALNYLEQAIAIQPDHVLALHARKQITGDESK